MKYIIVLLIFLMLFAPVCHAADISLPEVDYGEYVNEDELDENEGFNLFQKAIEIIGDSFGKMKGSITKKLSTVIALIVLSSLLCSLKGDNKTLSTAIDYISILSLSLALYSLLGNAVQTIALALDSLTIFISSYLPVMASLYCMGGNTLAATASTNGMLIYLTLLQGMGSSFFFPMYRLCFAAMLSGALPSVVDLRSLWNLIRNTMTSLLVFLFSTMNFLLSFQTILSAGKDTLALRSVRFAGGSFIPVIGSLLGEASKTVYASVASIKSISGSAALIALMSIVLPPIITVIIYKLLVLFCAMLARILGCERESGFLYDINGLLGILLALICGAASVFVIATGIFVSTNGGLSV